MSLVIGLMSGTSYDGTDAALVAIEEHGLRTKVDLIAFESVPYTRAARRLVADLCLPTATVDKVCLANMLLGELFAEAAIAVAEKAGASIGKVELIGSHGQTIHHLPKPVRVAGRRVAGTLQIGEPSVIAERTGVTTVADFRPRDMACGGQGAPLVPYVDYLLFRHRSRARVLLNIGGIANVTYLPPGCRADEAVAFDTGPGNMLLDGLARRLTHGQLGYDKGGALAAKGSVDAAWLRRLLRHPYFRRRPPKSTGREEFGDELVERLLSERAGRGVADVLATVTALTAESIHRACTRFLGPVDELIASGGGCHNHTLMAMLSERFPRVCRSDDYGIPADAKEAIAFAILANETVAGRPGNLPGATGAAHAAVLGKIVPGR
jgi:anhydro-N-acetylmuramic acid kinase